jgi:hypothetical protein
MRFIGCRESRSIPALTRPSFALSLGRVEAEGSVAFYIHRSLSRISLFFFLRDRPESLGDRTPYHQQTLGSSCVPWFVASSCPTDVGRSSMSPSGANDKAQIEARLQSVGEIYAPDFSNGTIAAKS